MGVWLDASLALPGERRLILLNVPASKLSASFPGLEGGLKLLLLNVTFLYSKTTIIQNVMVDECANLPCIIERKHSWTQTWISPWQDLPFSVWLSSPNFKVGGEGDVMFCNTLIVARYECLKVEIGPQSNYGCWCVLTILLLSSIPA